MTENDADWYGQDAATFGDRLAAAREAADMKQAQLARRLGIKTATLANWENDVSEPRTHRLSMLAGILNVSVMWLLMGEGEGLSAPEEGEGVDPDVQALLAELREVRGQFRHTTERLSRLEKRLRAALAG